jgi:hypothetical protein
MSRLIFLLSSAMLCLAACDGDDPGQVADNGVIDNQLQPPVLGVNNSMFDNSVTVDCHTGHCVAPPITGDNAS